LRSIFLFIVSIFLTCCRQKDPQLTSSFSGVAMTIPYIITIGDSLSWRQELEVKRLIKKTFKEVDERYNNWNSHSEISRLNQVENDLVTPISRKLLRLLLVAEEVYLLSEGRFDPTIEPARKMWRAHLRDNTAPSFKELSELKEIIGFNKVFFKGGIFHKQCALTEMDLGGIAKGFAVDRLVEELNNAGDKGLLVEWRGKVRASGRHPEERPWIIGILDIAGVEKPFDFPKEISLFDCALATSGDYLQNWTVSKHNKKITYTHVIDPFTLEPLQVTKGVVASVTVKAQTCALADGLATAAMLFNNLADAKQFAQKIEKEDPTITFWFVER
jgi:FAD:protein FMN transferase